MPALTPQASQDYLHAHIPMSKAMAVEVQSASRKASPRCPLAHNINHRDTVFGGIVVLRGEEVGEFEGGFVAIII